MNVAVVLVAAGNGERLGAGIPKALVEVGGKSLLAHALTSIQKFNLSVERREALTMLSIAQLMPIMSGTPKSFGPKTLPY